MTAYTDRRPSDAENASLRLQKSKPTLYHFGRMLSPTRLHLPSMSTI